MPFSLDRPLRIAHFSDVYLPQVNGVAFSLNLLANHLRQAGHQVTIFAPKIPHFDDSEPWVRRFPSVRIHRQPPVYLALPGTPRSTWALRQGFDVLHTHSPLTLGFLAYLSAHLKDLPLIYTYHTSIPEYTHYLRRLGETRLAERLANRFSRLTCNVSDYVVAPSVKFERILLQQRVHRPIRVIPNGIDLEPFRSPKSPGAFRKRLGIRPRDPLLLFVGRLGEEKRPDFLVEAFARVARWKPDAHFVLAGDGKSREGLQQLASKLGLGGRIHFLGVVDRRELPDLYHDADLFVSASTSEVHPLTVIESLACGLPFVAVWDEALTGMITDGINGWIAPLNVDAFARKIRELLERPDLAQAFGRASLRFSRNYSIGSQVDSLTQLYYEAAERKEHIRWNDLQPGGRQGGHLTT